MTCEEWTSRLLDRSQPVFARVEAARKVADSFPDYRAWQALCSVIASEDEDPTVRCEAVRALPAWNRQAAIEKLTNASSNRQVRNAALEALQDLGSVTAEQETGTAEIDWFRIRNADWIEAFQVGPEISAEEHFEQRGDSGQFRSSYLRSCLQISEEGDSTVLLLNPEVVTDSGEWERPGSLRIGCLERVYVPPSES